MITQSGAIALVRLSPADASLIASLEAACDREIAKAHTDDKIAGAPVMVGMPPACSPKIAHALARRYREQGKFHVAVHTEKDQSIILFSHPDRADDLRPMHTPAPEKAAAPALLPFAKSPYRVLVRMPTRSRPQQALERLALYRTLAGIDITLEVVIDEDDASMRSPLVLERLRALDCVVTVGLHGSKVAACNAGRVTDWDILLLASDDMVPVEPFYARRIVALFEEHWPHLDGALHLKDGYANERVCTIPLMGQRLYDRFGYVYHPDYQSLYCDNEQTRVFQALGRLVYVDELLIRHAHFVTGAKRDALYDRNEALGEKDRAIYHARKDRHFDLHTQLTVCIATMPERARALQGLLDELYRQIDDQYPPVVDVLVDADEGSVGAKRKRLLARATGKYVCFVDDDDMVSPDYIHKILSATVSDPDCVALRGLMVKDGVEVLPFEHSIKYTSWDFQNGLYERMPNHLNPVKLELARKAGFPDLKREEDRAYSSALRPLLQTEATTGKEPLYYYFFKSQK